MMKVKNKWNGRIYTVKCFNNVNNNVTLIRDDGSEFTIARGEFKFSYRKECIKDLSNISKEEANG